MHHTAFKRGASYAAPVAASSPEAAHSVKRSRRHHPSVDNDVVFVCVRAAPGGAAAAAAGAAEGAAAPTPMFIDLVKQEEEERRQAMIKDAFAKALARAAADAKARAEAAKREAEAAKLEAEAAKHKAEVAAARRKAEQDAQAPPTCAICLEPVKLNAKGKRTIPQTLECMHVYHSACIKRWLRRKPECPQCKHQVKHQVHVECPARSRAVLPAAAPPLNFRLPLLSQLFGGV